MKPTEDQIKDAMCKVSFPFFPGMTRGETEWKVKQFVAELFNIVGTQSNLPPPLDSTCEYGSDDSYNAGWNDCINAMIEAAPKFGEEE